MNVGVFMIPSGSQLMAVRQPTHAARGVCVETDSSSLSTVYSQSPSIADTTLWQRVVSARRGLPPPP